MRPQIFFLLLVMLSISCSSQKLTLVTGDTETTIYLEEKTVLSYVHSETLPPEGVDPIYKRSAYIHPPWSPGGEPLTRIQPDDHYHHYGIWNPWTRTHFGEYKVDFWNLKAGQGTVRFVEYIDKFEGKDRAGFVVKHDHIYYLEDGTEEVAIEEIWEVTASTSKEGPYLVDLTTILTTPLAGGITLEAYRYGGGLGFRATEKWGDDNSSVLTSEGKTRKDADGTGARWVIVEGESSVPEGRSGILFLSHSSNRAHPESMRMWPPGQYEGKGILFFEFCPIRHQEWVLETGRQYELKYRMIVFDGKLDTLDAERYWNDFVK